MFFTVFFLIYPIWLARRALSYIIFFFLFAEQQLSIIVLPCIITGWIPYCAPFHFACVGNDGWRVGLRGDLHRFNKRKKSRKSEPFEPISLSGIFISLPLFVFVVSGVDEFTGREIAFYLVYSTRNTKKIINYLLVFPSSLFREGSNRWEYLALSASSSEGSLWHILTIITDSDLSSG